MNPGYFVRPAQEEDIPGIGEIFNHYVRETYAAYPIEDVDPVFFQSLLREAASYPLYVVKGDECLLGFGMIRPYLPFPSFRHTAQISYFIRPDHTRKGLGTLLLEHLTADARARGIRIFLANISSRNEPSLRFHAKHGYSECGRLKGIGEKFGARFDIVWMQKQIE
jgi:phosphinothricin acetyltransferase